MEKLTHDLLRRLLAAGYNILESDRAVNNNNAIFRPVRVDDIDAYLRTRGNGGAKEHIIADTLESWDEADLRGIVEMPSDVL